MKNQNLIVLAKPTLYKMWILLFALLTCQETLATNSLLFLGNPTNDDQRVKIQIDDPTNSNPGPPADIGSDDFTLEFWMKTTSGNNAGGGSPCGVGWNSWIDGNIIFDRDRFNQGRSFGISIYNGVLRFGLGNGSEQYHTLCGTTNVVDGQWHHIAVQRRLSDGWMSLYVDGNLDVQADGPNGDISYPDNGLPFRTIYNSSDPYLVIGAEKHDANVSVYPSYSGFVDEVRLSNSIRYPNTSYNVPTQPFGTDGNTVTLYHFNEGSGTVVNDTSGASGGPSNGVIKPGVLWSMDTPFSEAPSTGTIGLTVTTDRVGEADDTYEFIVTRSGGVEAVSVDYVIGGTGTTASTGKDYQATSGTLNWAGGDSSSKTLTVYILDDVDVESDETVVLTLNNPTGGATMDISSATLIIQDDDVSDTIQFDNFERPDSSSLGNGWIEKQPDAFTLLNGEVVKQSVSTGYRDNVVYRPASEDLLDQEVSIELNWLAGSIGYPQIFTRLQSTTVAQEGNLNGYILYVSDSTTQAILSRQTGGNLDVVLATLNLSTALNTTDRFRLRLRATGISPVELSAWVEQFVDDTWQIIGQAEASDFAVERIATAGTAGFGGDSENSYTFNNFHRRDLDGDGDDDGSNNNSIPVATLVTPDNAPGGSGKLTIIIDGSDFIASSVVRWNGSNRPTTFVSENELEADISAADLATPGRASVTVFNPVGGGESDPLTFTVAVDGVDLSDDFNRPDSTTIDNGWIEMTPNAFAISNGQVMKQPTSTGYLENLVYRPVTEDLLDVEVSVQLQVNPTAVGFPQLYARIQSSTVSNGWVDGYILYVNNSATELILGRQRRYRSVRPLSSISLVNGLNSGSSYRMRLQVSGTNPVLLQASIETQTTVGNWQIIGQTAAVDSSNRRINTAGSVGFSGYVYDGYVYDNFQRVKLDQ